MHRIAIEIPITTMAAAMIASFVLIAGIAIGPSAAPIMLPVAPVEPLFEVLCTPSYCEPPTVLPGPLDGLMQQIGEGDQTRPITATEDSPGDVTVSGLY